MIRRKLISGLVLLVISLCVFGGTIWAYGDQSTYFLFNGATGGHGEVDGSANGKYYSLTPGNVRLDLVNTLTTVPSGFYGTKECWIILKREIDWSIDQSYGTNTIYYSQNGYSTTSRWSVDTNSSKYYIYVSGGDPGFSYLSSGIMYDHY
ncbi:hypothetical protein [Pseudobacteroides cellulosolvens]|uniref:Uncharacterized protein n=1 Tax=Pseudobacteroides cellulosolvens ATCC 35603 = DSM 2933 TaxID=398512 RepID=A0A0L6JYA2_9FIRM|nr:hypothetical protein [Pseudobacteroides cellulosolvens]KNY30520.1 hypothetical protein Bccel_5800 [Pseudobacteroides cellulosolvens ATCC 35603 = DSM 2933]